MKITCTDYVKQYDRFYFKLEETGDALPENSVTSLTGDQIADLEDRKLVSCSDIEIGIFMLYRKNFRDEPSSMLNKLITI